MGEKLSQKLLEMLRDRAFHDDDDVRLPALMGHIDAQEEEIACLRADLEATVDERDTLKPLEVRVDEQKEVIDALRKDRRLFERDLTSQLDREYAEKQKPLAEYSAEFGIDLTMQALIDSHRRLIEEIEAGSRAEHKVAMQRAADMVTQMVMDATWIKIETLRGMTMRSLARLVGEGDE